MSPTRSCCSGSWCQPSLQCHVAHKVDSPRLPSSRGAGGDNGNLRIDGVEAAMIPFCDKRSLASYPLVFDVTVVTNPHAVYCDVAYERQELYLIVSHLKG